MIRLGFLSFVPATSSVTLPWSSAQDFSCSFKVFFLCMNVNALHCGSVIPAVHALQNLFWYYDALAECQNRWHEGSEGISPSIKHLLGTILVAYRDFDERACLITAKLPAVKVARRTAYERIGKSTKNDIWKCALPSVKHPLKTRSKSLWEEGLSSAKEQESRLSIQEAMRAGFQLWNLSNPVGFCQRVCYNEQGGFPKLVGENANIFRYRCFGCRSLRLILKRRLYL